MTQRTIETTVYTIESHPDPERVFDRIRDNWHGLGDFCLQEMVESLEAFSDHIGATLDYSISIVPDRGEFVRFDCHHALSDVLQSLDLSGNCPFTGMCYDETILDAFRDCNSDDSLSDVLRDVEYRVLKCLHNEGEYIYSDEGLRELCEAHEYEFTDNGAIV